MERTTKLQCPFDGGPLPVISAVSNGGVLTMLYVYCPWCQAVGATIWDEEAGRLHEVAILAYDHETERHSFWGEQPSVPEEWRVFAVQHAPH